jgi:hypothetical protein
MFKHSLGELITKIVIIVVKEPANVANIRIQNFIKYNSP